MNERACPIISVRLVAAVVAATALILLSPSAVRAQEAAKEVVAKSSNYGNVRQDLEDAIIAGGFKIDFNGKVADMLQRTGKDIGATKTIYNAAEYLTFCSASLSRTAMEADPANLAVCPYVIYVYERADAPGKVHVGYRKPAAASGGSKAAVAEIDQLLDKIVAGVAK